LRGFYKNTITIACIALFFTAPQWLDTACSPEPTIESMCHDACTYCYHLRMDGNSVAECETDEGCYKNCLGNPGLFLYPLYLLE